MNECRKLIKYSTHLVLLSRFESMAIGNDADVKDGSENLPLEDLAGLSERILSDELSVDMAKVKKERTFWAVLLLPTYNYCHSVLY